MVVIAFPSYCNRKTILMSEGMACDARYASIMKPSCTGGSLGNMPDFNLKFWLVPCDTPRSRCYHNTYRTQATASIYPNPSPAIYRVDTFPARCPPPFRCKRHADKDYCRSRLPDEGGHCLAARHLYCYLFCRWKIITSGKVVVEWCGVEKCKEIHCFVSEIYLICFCQLKSWNFNTSSLYNILNNLV